MLQSLSGRSKSAAALLVFFVSACGGPSTRVLVLSKPAKESSVTITPGDLFYVLPRRVCTSARHVGDTVTALVWRARPSIRDNMVGIAPDPAIPDSLLATMRVVRIDDDTSASGSPIQFAVQSFSLGDLHGSAPTTNPLAEPAPASRVNTRALVSMERCYPAGHSLAGGLTDSLVLR